MHKKDQKRDFRQLSGHKWAKNHFKTNFSYMNPYSPISWLYVYGFLGQNSKNWILRLLLDIWKSGSVCVCNCGHPNTYRHSQ